MPNSATHIVKAGENLAKIAKRFGTTVQAIAQANGISNINKIKVGQVLKIPASPPPSPAPKPPTQAPSPPKPPVAAPSPPAPPAPAPQPVGGPVDFFGADNLSLGVNQIFEAAIKEAAERTGMSCQTVAAIINAEAAKKTNGQWDPKSKAGTSSASGLTQFLDGTWRGEAQRAGGILNAEAKALGFVSAQNRIVNDAALLQMRFDPRMAILAGADFARNNLAAMRKAGVIGADVAPAALAKLAYFAHHEGPGGAIKLLKGDTGFVRQSQFNANVPPKKRAGFMTGAGQDLGRAYRAWLCEYTDSNINVTKFMKNSAGVNVVSVSTFCRN